MAGEGEWESVKLKFDSQDLMGSTPNLYRSDRTKSKRTAGSVLGSSSSSLSSALERSSLEDVGRWEVDSNELELGRELGKGAFGTVFKGKLRGKEVAIKKLNVPDFDEDALLDFKQEVEILSKLRHPNVVLFMGTCLKPGNYMMVTEFMPKGSLFDILRSETELPLKRRMKMAKDAALGMNWLHQSKPIFVHRDLKTQNLLVDENWTVKVADFGLSYIKKGSSSSGSFGAIGTPLWMAPEVLQNREYDEKCDVYSFGIVLWELLTNKTPFEEITTYAAMVDAVAVQHRRPPIPEDCPDRLKQLITACWHPDPANRPSFAEIIPMFDEIIVDSLINDENGRKMWKKYFMKDKLREVVSWKNFVIALTNLFKTRAPKETDDTRWKCLKAIVCDDTDKVNIEQFGRILEWFGPMEGLNVLEDVEDLLKRDWFHGDVSSEDAEKKLAKERKGTYLVRFSSRDPGCFAISVVSQGGRLKHYRIYHKPGLKYLIGKSECDSLDQIIVKYHKELYLKYPCEGSPFQEIFEEKKTAISAGYLVPDFE